MAEYVRYRLTPLQVLQSASLRNAADLGYTGNSANMVTAKVAGIVQLNRNRLEDIAATRAIHGVVLKGDYLDRDVLDAMLAAVRARVAAREAEAH